MSMWNDYHLLQCYLLHESHYLMVVLNFRLDISAQKILIVSLVGLAHLITLLPRLMNCIRLRLFNQLIQYTAAGILY